MSNTGLTYDDALTAEHLLCWFTAEAAAEALELSADAVRAGLANFQRRGLVRHDGDKNVWLLARPGACSNARQIALQLGELALVSARLSRQPHPQWLGRELSDLTLLERLLSLRARS